MNLDELKILFKILDQRCRMLNLGRGYMCRLKSAVTPGKARLPRRLKKATKRFMYIRKLSSMVIMPQGLFVCFKHNGDLYVCHTRY